MSDKARIHARLNAGNAFEYFDVTSQEVANIVTPLQFSDDFIGGGHTAGIPVAGSPVAGYPWVKRIVGAAPPTVALVGNAAGGVIACTLAATSEKEDAALYWNDNLSIDANRAPRTGRPRRRAQLVLARASSRSTHSDPATQAADTARASPHARGGGGAHLGRARFAPSPRRCRSPLPRPTRWAPPARYRSGCG